MNKPRRFFLKSASMTALTAAMTFGGGELALGQKKSRKVTRGLGVPFDAQTQPTFMFTAATFEPYVGSYFEVPDPLGRLIPLKLLSVNIYKKNEKTKLMRAAETREAESFSLIFVASEPLPKFTSIHKMSHPSLGDFYLFMTPRVVDGEYFYEAVFSHVRS